jgi:hypothetical protein
VHRAPGDRSRITLDGRVDPLVPAPDAFYRTEEL